MQIAAALDYVGVLAVELFVSGGRAARQRARAAAAQQRPLDPRRRRDRASSTSRCAPSAALPSAPTEHDGPGGGDGQPARRPVGGAASRTGTPRSPTRAPGSTSTARRSHGRAARWATSPSLGADSRTTPRPGPLGAAATPSRHVDADELADAVGHARRRRARSAPGGASTRAIGRVGERPMIAPTTAAATAPITTEATVGPCPRRRTTTAPPAAGRRTGSTRERQRGGLPRRGSLAGVDAELVAGVDGQRLLRSAHHVGRGQPGAARASMPSASYIAASSAGLGGRVRSPARGARSCSSRSISSFCADTLIHSPAAMLIPPARRRPARPGARCDDVDAAAGEPEDQRHVGHQPVVDPEHGGARQPAGDRRCPGWW